MNQLNKRKLDDSGIKKECNYNSIDSDDSSERSKQPRI